MKRTNLFSFSILAASCIYLFSACETKVETAVSTISVDSARTWVATFNEQIIQTKDSLRFAAQSNSFLYKAEFFTKRDLEAILAQDGCTGIRVYHGINSKGKAVMCIVGTAGNENQLPIGTAGNQGTNDKQRKRDTTGTAPESGTKAVILKSEVPCPEMCPTNGL